jgi:hypothetical protein
MDGIAVVDEFTSVIDRQVAQIGSASIAKSARKNNKQLILLTCHYDVLDWLEPDWVYQPHLNKMYTGRSHHQRPKLNLEIRRVHRDAWKIFSKHHYLDSSLHTASRCFVGFIDGVPATFSSVLHFPHATAKNIKREHRTVCLPDFQGVGLGNVMSDTIASAFKSIGFRYRSQTSHPGMIGSRNNSNNWKMDSTPSITLTAGKTSSKKTGKSGMSKATAFGLNGFGKRLIASFEYVGPKMDYKQAFDLINN